MHKLNAACDEQLSMLNNADEVVLYGKTVMSTIIANALVAFGIGARIRIFDSGAFIDGGEIDGCSRVIILCGIRAKTRESMRKSSAGFFPNNIVLEFSALYYGWLTRIVKRECDCVIFADTIVSIKEEKAIHNIDSINTTFCNINCKECANGVQYRNNKKQIPTDEHIAYLKRLTDVSPISLCNLQGGEALLDKNFPELLRRHAQNPRIAVITVATNGAILPNPEIMIAMKETGAIFRISDYGDLSSKKNEIISLSAQLSVPCELYPRAEKWYVYGELTPRNRSAKDNCFISENCFFGTKDLMFYGNNFFCCCRTLFAEACGLDVEAVRANILDLDSNFSQSELDIIVKGGNLHLMCDYCDFPMKEVAPAEQMPRAELIN